MRLLLILAFAAVACGSALYSPSKNAAIQPMADLNEDNVLALFDHDSEVEVINEEGTEEGNPRFILSWQIRRFIRKQQKQMPCGWPKYGIPPLAPYRREVAVINVNAGNVQTLNQLQRFKVDGLDNFSIKKLKLNMLFKKVKFDFLFRNIDVTSQNVDTDTFLDFMKELGLSVRYEGGARLQNLKLVNIRISGVLHYKLPILWGSAKITSLKTNIRIESGDAQVQGIVPEGRLSDLLSKQIGDAIVNGINNNAATISDLIEGSIVPKINKQLKGKDFWSLIDLIFSSNEKETDPIISNCVPPEDPWA